jgi:selenocysteine lyase/cysteine desulfurase
MWSAARRFEGGTANAAGILAFGASLELLLSFGIDAIWSRLSDITERLRHVLESCGFVVRSSHEPDRRSGIVSCEVTTDERQRIQSTAQAAGVILNFREGLMRLSPHAYTNDADLERLRSLLTHSDNRK